MDSSRDGHGRRLPRGREIVAAAVRLFSEHGIEAVTVDEIAAAADVGKGTIYNYFETKEDIVVAFLLHLEHQLQEQVGRLITRRGSLEFILGSFLRFHFQLKEPYHPFVRVFLAQMFSRAT